MTTEPRPLSDLPDDQALALARWVMRSLGRIDAADRRRAASTSSPAPVMPAVPNPSVGPDAGHRLIPRRPAPARLSHRL